MKMIETKKWRKRGAPFLRSVLRWSWVWIALLAVLPRSASAQSIIKNNAASPDFSVELEPHAILTPFAPPGASADGGLGAGILVGINIAPRGFIPSIADSVSIGIGVDWVHYFGGSAVSGECAEWVGSGDEAICVRVRGGGSGGNYFYLPGVMQWNFYLTRAWSVFGEPGFAMYMGNSSFDSSFRFSITPVFNAGGRWHFSKNAHLVLRAGYPYTSVGLSFYL